MEKKKKTAEKDWGVFRVAATIILFVVTLAIGLSTLMLVPMFADMVANVFGYHLIGSN